MKYLWYGIDGILVLILSMVALVICQWPDQNAHLVFCDVGQGDGILIWHGFNQVVIDAGKDEAMLSCLRRYLPWWDTQLEMVVATHADADHIGGLDEIMANFAIQQVLLTNQAKKTAEFEVFVAAIKSQLQSGSRLIFAQAGQQLKMTENLTAEILWPLRSPDEEKMPELVATETQLSDTLAHYFIIDDDGNAGSIVILLHFGAARVLLTGDAEEKTESALIARGLTSDIDILKVGHHGSKNGTSQSFIAEFQPEKAVISSGKNNQYGHPDEEVLRRLEEKGIAILRTDHEGDIHVISNTRRFWFKTQRALNLPD